MVRNIVVILVGFYGLLAFSADNSPLLVKEVTVIDGTGKDPYVASVLVENSKISKIIKGDLVPVSKATVINGKGKFLLPGFIDTLAHISLRSHLSGNIKDFNSGELESLYRDLQEKDAQKRLKKYKVILRQSLRSGVTTFVDSVTSIADVGMIRAEINSTDYPNFLSLGPVLGIKGSRPAIIETTVNPKDPNSGWKYWLPELNDKMSLEDRQAALAILRSDLTKMMRDSGLAGLFLSVDSPAENGQPATRIPLETIGVVVEVAKSFQKPVFFTASSNEGLQDAARAGANIKVGAPLVVTDKGVTPAGSETFKILSYSKVTLLSGDSSNGQGMAQFLAEPMSLAKEGFLNGTIPLDTKTAYAGLLKEFFDDNSKNPDHENFKKSVQGRLEIAKMGHGALASAHKQFSINIVPTGEEGNPFAFHGTFPRELVLLNGRGAQSQDAVLTPQEIISGATLGAATLMNLQDTLGSIEVGKTADLLLLDANPLSDMANVRKMVKVIKGGKVVNFLSAPN